MDDQNTPKEPIRKTPNATSKNYVFGVVAALLVTLSFIAGVFVGDIPATVEGYSPETEQRLVGYDAKVPKEVQDVEFAQFWEVWNMVKERYVDKPVDDVSLFYGAIEGMVGSLDDPYSVYFDPELANRFTQELEGSFEGIGAEIGVKKEQLIVIAPLDDTPAFRSGLKAGDYILMVDEVDTQGMHVEEAVRIIRGEAGTEVVLTIWREGLTEPMEIPITRGKIVVEAVKMSVIEDSGKKFAHIKISHFNEQVVPKLNEVARQILLEDISGIILDLRNNPGGFLDTAVEVSGEWVLRDVIVVEKFSDEDSRNYTSRGNARFADYPTVVLVNGGSASASEIVAGALQDYEKAYILGEQTFGKGSVQDYVELRDGSALKLTIAKWLTPLGRSINQEGIAPDEVVEYTIDDFENSVDPQLDRAVEALVSPETQELVAEEDENDDEVGL